MSGAATNVVSIPSRAIINGIARRIDSMLGQSLEQRNLLILLSHQDVAEPMRNSQRAARSDRIHEQRMRSIERMDEASPVCQLCPASRLDGATDFQCQFIKILFLLAG